MDTGLRDSFLQLVRFGIGSQGGAISNEIDWNAIESIAEMQGLLAIVLDGVESLPAEYRPPKDFLLQWIGNVMQIENSQALQWKAERELALLLKENQIKTYVLKGSVVSECYPTPTHRQSVDMDCFLQSFEGNKDVWEKGNKIIEEKGIEVERIHYKNSTWFLPDLTVENHKFITPFRGNKRLEKLERQLQSMLRDDNREDRFEGTWLFRPPVMVSALFMIEHAYSHFLHEGLTWRHILDWMMFSKKHKEDIDWPFLNSKIDEYGFRRFYDSYSRLGQYLIGGIQESSLTVLDKRMLEDVWKELDLHETVTGIKGKIALAGNTWRARWKYKYFSEISMVHALWIQVTGFIFMKSPSLD